MRTKFLLLIFFLVGFHISSKAALFSLTESDSAFFLSSESIVAYAKNSIENVSTEQQESTALKSSKLAQKYKSSFHENKKVTAAVLTFALGMLGVHRLYLGTKPWIPAVYLLTFGGGFLILPFIDFVVILLTDDISKYENNDKVLMWVK